MTLLLEQPPLTESLTAQPAVPSGSKIASRPRVLVVCPKLGLPSEVWLWRQIVGFQTIRPAVLCWGYVDPAEFPVGDIAVFELPEIARQQRFRRLIAQLSRVPTANFYSASRDEQQQIEDFVLDFDPDLILCQFGHTVLRVLPIARRYGIPIVAHFHGHDISAMLRDPKYRFSLRMALPGFDGVVVVAKYQYDWVMAHGAPVGHTHIIPCGVPIAEYASSAAVGNDACRFLSVGRLVEKKGPLETIRAFASGCRDIPGANLQLIGDGPLMEQARLLARNLGISDRVDLAGVRTPAEVGSALQQASAYVQLSRTASNGDMEGWPVALAEAMTSGLPVIANRHAGIVDQVEEGVTGYLTAEGDVDAAASFMRRIAADKELRSRLGDAARRTALERFDSRRQINCLERAVRCVLASRSPSN